MKTDHVSKRGFDEVSYWQETEILFRHQPSTRKQQVTERSQVLIIENLPTLCQLAWNKVKGIFGDYYLTAHHLVTPEEIIDDSCQVYTTVVDGFANYDSPARLAVILGEKLINIRQKYCRPYPQILGLVAMQFYHVSQNVSGCLSPQERLLFKPYLEVVDDYLYLPLGDLGKSIKGSSEDSPTLLAVEKLLQEMNSISLAIYHRVSQLNPNYYSKSGPLKDSRIKDSSVRDIKLFLSYICLCVLTGSISPLERELFPLCAMLYPKLGVSWKLIEDLLLVLFWEVSARLNDQDITIFLPCFRAINKIFAEEILTS
jgi:hypothetical protein